ncbi:unnamed protein product [Brugia timori]|uniref:Uncharacterized protein n=1 Tax=Brugia timori TaxID=42155 RepID=A0A0R3QSN1_9BILA|nr:unnamed protein product [Brugia timori]
MHYGIYENCVHLQMPHKVLQVITGNCNNKEINTFRVAGGVFWKTLFLKIKPFLARWVK